MILTLICSLLDIMPPVSTASHTICLYYTKFHGYRHFCHIKSVPRRCDVGLCLSELDWQTSVNRASCYPGSLMLAISNLASWSIYSVIIYWEERAEVEQHIYILIIVAPQNWKSSTLVEFKCLKDVCVNVSAGVPRATGPNKTVKAVKGRNAILEYNLDPRENESLTFDVKRADLDVDPNVVYFYRHGQDHPHARMDQYRDRMTLIHLDPRRGNLTLQISSVKLSDSGWYRLFVARQKAGYNIYLTVGKHAERSI